MDLRGKDCTEATLFFLSRGDKYRTEKPYATRYDPEGLFPQTNIEVVAHKVRVQSLRPFIDCPSYDKTGFQVARLDSQMRHEDYADHAKIRDIHLPEVENLVRKLLGACQVHILEFAIRRQHPEFPVATGYRYDTPQPTSRVHLDYTCEYVCNTILPLVDNYSATVHPRWQCVNVWHPINGAVKNWPLALCDASTIDFAADTMAGDIVERAAVLENMQVHYNSNHSWYWLPDQLPSELLIFKNADSQSVKNIASHGAAHAAFEIADTSTVNRIRESIEIRLLVLWHDEDK